MSYLLSHRFTGKPRVAFIFVKDATLNTSMGAWVFQGVLCANSHRLFLWEGSPRLLLTPTRSGLGWSRDPRLACLTKWVVVVYSIINVNKSNCKTHLKPKNQSLWIHLWECDSSQFTRNFIGSKISFPSHIRLCASTYRHDEINEKATQLVTSAPPTELSHAWGYLRYANATRHAAAPYPGPSTNNTHKLVRALPSYVRNSPLVFILFLLLHLPPSSPKRGPPRRTLFHPCKRVPRARDPPRPKTPQI